MADLRALANEAGVSIRTVNRVLKREGYVHTATRRVVEAAVAKLGYHPNLTARALKTSRSHFVSVLTFSDDELRMAQVAALEQRLRQADYLVAMTFQSETQSRTRIGGVLREILGQNPAGLALLGHEPHVTANVLPALMPGVLRSGLPYVLIDPKGSRNRRHDAVTVDRGQGVFEAVHHLARKGARRIAFLGTQEERTRLDGYEKALRELGRPTIFLDYPGTDLPALREGARRFARQKVRADAVVAHSDHIALAFLAGLLDAGVRVPEDVALVGFDDRMAAQLSWPTLTTIAQPGRQVGEAAAEILLRKLAGETGPAGGWSQSFPTRLVLRETA